MAPKMFDKFNSFLLFFPELYMAIKASSYDEISPEYDNYILHGLKIKHCSRRHNRQLTM